MGRKARILGQWRHRMGQHILRVPAVQLIIRTVRELGADDGPHLAAGVAYYALLSLFPLILGIIAILGIFLPSQNVQEKFFELFRAYMPGSVDAVEQNISDVIRFRGPTGVLSLILLFWAASAMFGAVSRVINRAFFIRHEGAFVKRKLRDIAMAVGVGLLVTFSIMATNLFSVLKSANVMGFSAAPDIVARAVGFTLIFMVFLLLYKLIPNTRTYWRYVWTGALLAAILFELAKSLFVLYVDEFGNYESIYGSLGSFVALLLWLYISAFILMLGAEFSCEYGRMKEESIRRVIEEDAWQEDGGPQL